MNYKKEKGFVRIDFIGSVMGLGLFWYFFTAYMAKQNPGDYAFESFSLLTIMFLYLISMVIAIVVAILGDDASWGDSRDTPASQFIPCIVIAIVLTWWLANDVISIMVLMDIGVFVCIGYYFNYRRQFGLINAIAASDQKFIERYLEKPRLLNVKGGRHGPLHTAIDNQNFDVADKLLAGGAEIDWPGYYGITALGNALSEKIEAIRYLLDKGADPNKLLPGGDTYLMALVHHPQKQARGYQKTLNDVIAKIRLLIAAGADPAPTNESGESAADIALRREIPELANVLTERGE